MESDPAVSQFGTLSPDCAAKTERKSSSVDGLAELFEEWLDRSSPRKLKGKRPTERSHQRPAGGKGGSKWRKKQKENKAK
jgi:hypothetical protein